MPYVQRDGHGAVSGVFANPQPGYAEEWLDAADAAIVAFFSPPTLTAQDIAAITAALQPGNPQRAIMLLAMQRTNAIGAAINAINVKIGLTGNDITTMTQQQLIATVQSLIR